MSEGPLSDQRGGAAAPPPVLIPDPRRVELRAASQPSVYDRDFQLGTLLLEPEPGEEHYLVRYPAGLRARWHRHRAAHTILVLEGQLEVNGSVFGPGAYCHLPGGRPMHHAPAGDGPCTFLLLFHGPFDVEPLDDPPPARP